MAFLEKLEISLGGVQSEVSVLERHATRPARTSTEAAVVESMLFTEHQYDTDKEEKGVEKKPLFFQKNILCVDSHDAEQYGCPYCGYFLSVLLYDDSGTRVRRCKDESCSLLSVTLDTDRDLHVTTIEGFGTFCPIEHPRASIPIRRTRSGSGMNGSMEYFRPNLIKSAGKDIHCFKCGDSAMYFGSHMQARVWSEESGQRIINLFLEGSTRAAISKNPDEYLVEIGACSSSHNRYLERLSWITGYGKTQGWLCKEILVDILSPESDGEWYKRQNRSARKK